MKRDYRSLSELPDEDAYWDDLTTRVVADLRPRLAARLNHPSGFWQGVTARAAALSALAAAAALVALLLAPERTHEPAAVTGFLRVPDDDPTVSAFLSAPVPPAIVSLVMLSTTRSSP